MKFFKLIAIFAITANLASAQIMTSSRQYTCEPAQEICGDMVDQNCDGKDIACEGDDKDRDGYKNRVDCDDKNPFIYPGKHLSCKSLCQQGTSQCQPDGTKPFCKCVPLCEATGSGKCYYISPIRGFDINSGSFKKPWESFSNINHQERDVEDLKYWKGLKAGDYLYILKGLHTGGTIKEKQGVGIELSGVIGERNNPITIKSYPGHNTEINPYGNYPGIYINDSGYINIEDIKINDATAKGIHIKNSDHIKISNVIIKETHRHKAPHTYGIHLENSDNVEISHSKIFDNFDTKAIESGGVTKEYSSNIFIENSKNAKLYKNTIFNFRPITANKTGGCIQVVSDQGDEKSGVVIVENNILWNCKFNAISILKTEAQILHNFVLNSEPMLIKNIDDDQIVRINNNTIIGSNALILSNSSNFLGRGKILYSKNVIIDDEEQSDTRPMISLVNIGNSFQNKKDKSSNVIIDKNCYHTPKEISLTFTSSIIKGLTDSEKKDFDFYLWKEFGYDVNSNFIEPNFNDNFDLLSLKCEDVGWKNITK